jgi:uncharacterized membrane protein YhhN
MISSRALLAAGAAAALGYLVLLGTAPPAWLAALKPLPVLALAAWVWPGPTPAARWVRIGLLVCAAGDVLLGLGASLPGVGVFLLAHLLYIAAFLAETRRRRLLRALPFLVWGIAMMALLVPVLGRHIAPVGAYAVALCAMMWRAAALFGDVPRARAGSALAGAILFGASDTLLALHRYYTPWPDAPYLVMLLYWAGQAGLARSARPASGISAGFRYHHAGPPAA